MPAKTEDDLDTMAEAELLALPSQALPGGLSHLWAIRERQDRLLLRIEEEQREIDKPRKQIEDNALRLRDGRRVYVDGDRYRDGEGRVLSGPDEAEAARQHQYQPDTSTWEQKQEIERRAADIKRLKDKILTHREEGISPEEAGNRLSGYEKEFHDKIEARASQAPIDYGAVDHMTDYGVPSAVPAFMEAAGNVTSETVRKPADGETGTRTAELQKTLRPSGQGALKL
jgi:hypothetical protein